LPGPFPVGLGIFAGQGIGQLNPPIAPVQIILISTWA
jgi:hypothetical protein